MKILIVNSYDVQGGAARAAMRLHKALLNKRVNSEMLVQNKSSDKYTVIGPLSKIEKVASKVRSSLDQLPLRTYKKRSETHFSPSIVPFSNVVDQINEREADIVHLHWINEGMMRIEDLSKIKAPLVWTLHDMWPFTGGCHYSDGCIRYETMCGQCKVLASDQDLDLSRKIYRKKNKTFSNIDKLTIIGLSKWINLCSENSSLFKGREHINLPNPINTEIFKPFNKEQARTLWNLPSDKKLILFGAMGATSDPRKGFDLLKDALEKLNNENVELVVFGSSTPMVDQNFDYKTHYVGRINDNVSLVTLYNAVDVMVVPSLQENLSNVLMESLSCGLPVVAFHIGGNSDMIEHKKNGYLIKPFDTVDFANGINWILNNTRYEKLSYNCRDKVLREYDENIVVEQYINLYNKILVQGST